MTPHKKHNFKISVLCLGLLANIPNSYGADDPILDEMSTTIAETEIIFENCQFPQSKRDQQVNLFRAQKDMEYYYWEYVGCNVEWEMGQMALDVKKYEKSQSEPILTHQDYIDTCDSRIENVTDKINSYLSKTLPECESWQDPEI